MYFRFPAAAIALLAVSMPLLAQPAAAQAPAAPSPLFPFVLPWDDATPGTITDVSFLNAKPAGVHGYIIAKNGHFIETNTGQRVRFLATNFAAKSAFPSHADAEKVAARIAKLGINLVRLHHMDNSDWGQDASIWDYSYKDRQHISSVQLDKLDYLIAQFKKNGVYVNLNLHVSRQFSEADGFPPSVTQITTGFDKRVDEFDRRMIQLQKNYAHDLLTHVNPYTHLSYANDPAVMVVEINNENSLVGDPWATLGAELDTLPNPFRAELVGFWNTWLTKKYGTDAKLKAAWLKGITPTGPNLLIPTSSWSIEYQGTSHAQMTAEGQDIQAKITQVDGTGWHVQVHPTGLDLHNDTTYTVTFRAKSDTARTVGLAAGLDQNDWHNVGLDANAALTTDWKTFHYVFTAHDIAPNHNRLTFYLGDQTGTVWISDLQIHPGAEGAGLQPGQSLTTRTVDIPVSALKAQHDDWIAFLADTERAYADEMRGYLKKTLKIHANVICSQISWGGLTGLKREANMDFADNHAYWQHPSFPHKPWDSVDWNIPNTPMVADLADGKGGTFRDLAEYRVAGKPYTVSEYNHPAPNDYRAETLPELVTFADFEDWDAIYLFDYGEYGSGVQNDKINGYFGIDTDPAKTAFLPAAAIIFRAEAAFRRVETELDLHQTNGFYEAGGMTISASQKDVYSTTSVNALWQRWEHKADEAKLAESLPDGTTANVLESRVKKMKLHDPDIFADPLTLEYNLPNKPWPSILSGGHEGRPSWPRVTNSAHGAQYLDTVPSAQSLVGYVGGQTVMLGANTLTFPTFGNNFAAVTITAMDRQIEPPQNQKPIAQSHKLLLTLVGKVENQNMGWNADRTSVGDKWGNGPTVAEGIPAMVVLKTDIARHVWALDGTGKRVTEVPATYANGTLRFTVGPQYKTLWYEVGE